MTHCKHLLFVVNCSTFGHKISSPYPASLVSSSFLPTTTSPIPPRNQSVSNISRKSLTKPLRQIHASTESPKPDQDSLEPIQYFYPSTTRTTTSTTDTKSISPDIETIPLFPLSLVLTPGTSLPLHIFEMRYRLLFNRCWDQGTSFGIIMYSKERNTIAKIGCAAKVMKFDPLPDGRILTINEGTRRFKVLNYVDEKPYITARVHYFDDDTPESQESKQSLFSYAKDVLTSLEDVLSLSNKVYDKKLTLGKAIDAYATAIKQEQEQQQSNIDEQESIKRAVGFSFLVSGMLDTPVESQQRLLQLTSTIERLKRQNEVLEEAKKFLAAQWTLKSALENNDGSKK